MDTVKVSVIVPGHNAINTLRSCLAALRAQDWPADCLEIVYVDDASTDDSLEVASGLATVVARLDGLPQGPAAARNAAARKSSGEILVFMDADVVAPPGTVRALVEPLIKDQALDAIFGSYDSEPADRSVISQYRNLLHHFVHQKSREKASTFWAGCGAIRKRSFERAGEFDAKRYRTPMIEDIELGHRMRNMGMQIRSQPSIQVKHLKRWTFLKMLHADIFCRGIPWTRLLLQDNRKSGEIGDLNLKVHDVLSVQLAWAGALLILLSLWFPFLLYGVCLALGLAVLINMPFYRFFYTVRGLRFALMTIPLHLLYHLCNGLSVAGALWCRILIDRPLPGLKSIGSNLRAWYWRRNNERRRIVRNPDPFKEHQNHQGIRRPYA